MENTGTEIKKIINETSNRNDIHAEWELIVHKP